MLIVDRSEDGTLDRDTFADRLKKRVDDLIGDASD